MAYAVVNDVPPPPSASGFTHDLAEPKGGTNMKASAIVDAHATAGNTAEDGLKFTIGSL